MAVYSGRKFFKKKHRTPARYIDWIMENWLIGGDMGNTGYQEKGTGC